MKTHSPFIPQGSLLEQQRLTTRLVISSVLAAHVVFLSGLLLQGCKPARPEMEASAPDQAATAPPAVSTDGSSGPAPVPPPVSNLPTPPAPAAAQPAAPAPVQAPVAPAAARTHKVVSGDSFYRIARANGISVRALAEANPGIDSRKLRIGQVLQLPPAASAQPVAGTP